MNYNSTPHIKPLTSIRFFAAFFVVLRHLGFRPDSFFLDAATLGVTLFFILSGFVLSFSYQDRLLNKEIPTFRFYFARIARIYPIHIITFLLVILLFPVDFYRFRHYINNILLIQSFKSNELYYLSFNRVSWSLSVEMCFYLLFPCIIKFKNKILLLLTLILISIKVIYPLISNEKIIYIMYVEPILRLPDFIVGIFLFRFRKKITLIFKYFNTSILQIFSILILCIFIYLSKYVIVEYRYNIYYILPTAFIIFSFSLNNGLLGNLLSNKFLVLLGESSFSLYMIHSLVINYFIKELDIDTKNGLLLDWNESIFIIVISILLSILMYKYVETPLKNKTFNFLTNLFSKKRNALE